MTAIIPLGTFHKVMLMEAWPTEDCNFTPWLASADAIGLLGDALGMELEVEAVERWVGSFRADILARAINQGDHHVIIENQFGRTDHKHLGQILTYLAGVESAKTIVWIAETIQPDHRAAIDWLNTNTTEDFSFFAVEIELWRINDSPPAPRFNVVASPNDWVRRATSAAKQIDSAELAERHRKRLAYWASFAAFLDTQKSPFRIKSTTKDSWYRFGIGRSGFGIHTTITITKKRIGVELYLSGETAKMAFHALQKDKEDIEREFGEQLEWYEMPGKINSRISLHRYDADPEDETRLPELHAWALEQIERFYSVFCDRIRNLDLSQVADETVEDEEDGEG